MTEKPVDRVLILGLDGATWSLLGPWIQEGRLPGLSQALCQGVSGDLLSSIPPYSAPAWVSFATGMNPGKHGIVDFWQPTPDGSGRQPISALAVAAPTLWKQLGDAGHRVAVVNVPVTYPPSEVNGLLLSGMMTPVETSAWAYPPSLKDELLRLPGGYQVNPYATASQSELFLRRVLTWVPQRETAHRLLLDRERWSLFINVVQATDPIQHHFWNCLDASHPAYRPGAAKKYAELLGRCYAAIDSVVQDRISRLDEGTVLLIVSDHGFGPAHKYVHLNRLLADMGLLVFQQGTSDGAFRRHRPSMSHLYRLLRRLDPLNLRGHLSNRLRQSLRQVLDEAVAPPIDWSRTQAYAGRSSGESVYINLRGRDARGVVEPGSEFEELRGRILTALKALQDPETGDQVVEHAWRKEEIYEGPQVPWLPDILFRVSPHPYLPTDRLSVDDLFEEIPSTVGGGRHQPEGILVAVGSAFQRGSRVSGATITDIAPTVLHLLGQPIPEDMDGHVLEDLFDDAYLRAHPIRRGPPVGTGGRIGEPSPYSEDELELVTGHLRQLGYM